MSHSSTEAADNKHKEITDLVNQLYRVQQQLHTITEGELDYVLLPDGRSHMLQGGQDKLAKNEREQRELAATQLAILNSLPAHIAIVNTEGIILSVNEAWQRFASSNNLPHDVTYIGQNYLKICENATGYCSEEAHIAAEGLRKVLKGEIKEFSLEYPCHSPDEKRWFRLMINPLNKGAIKGAVVMHINITEIKLAESYMAESEARVRQLANRLSTTLESITDGFITLDKTWRYTSVNSEAERLIRRKEEDLVGRVIWEEYPEFCGTNFEKQLRKAVNEKVAVSFELFYGSFSTWYDIRAYPSTEGLVLYFRDITQSRNNAERIAEQAALLDKAQDAIIVRSLEHEVLFWNASAERLYGWIADEAIGKSINKLIYLDPSRFYEATRITLEKGEWMGELEHVTKTGEKLAVEGRWTLVKDEQNQPKSIMAINTDITERKKLEAQFLRSQRMESIGTLAGGIAHDLNNLLAPIVMGSDLLKETVKDPKLFNIIDNISRSAHRGASLVKQVLSFARGIEGERVSLHLHHVVREIENIIENTFPKNIVFNNRTPKNLWLIKGDPTQLNQVLLNLCVNARDAMPDGGTLTISGENIEIDKQYAALNKEISPGRYISIEVGDEGCGMSREMIDRVFEPFFTTKELGHGTGLGLSTVLAIVKSHGGYINVYSEVSRGSHFKIYLPAQSDLATLDLPSEQEELLPHGDGQCILVVDDELPLLSITKQTLEAFGYKVLTAEDGAQAIGIYANHHSEIAVVLTDMMMPVMDGPALIHALKRINPQVNIIAASGLNTNVSVIKATQAGVKHFIPKPYSAKRLLHLIKDLRNESE